MKLHRASIHTSLASTLIAAVLIAGCGGGGGEDTAPEVAPQAAHVDNIDPVKTLAATENTVQAYDVVPDEMVLNNFFADGLNNWIVGDAVLVNSTQRPGGKSLNVGWRALQRYAHNTLVPGASYTVKFRARNENSTGTTTVAMKFQIPPYNESFRTYQTTVTGTAWKDYEFQFTAPVFTKGELSILANGSRTVVDTISMKMRPAIATTESVETLSGSILPSEDYRLVFNDEFNGTALDRAKWHTRMIYNNGTTDRLHDEKQRYRDNDNHRVANGVLSLVARKVSSTDPNGINYESGMIRSDWTSRYGYYETRVKMPAGVGVWPAFWLNSDVSETGRLSWPPEIDIFEYVNNGVEDTSNMIHSNVVTMDRKPSQLFYSDPAFNPQYTYWRAPFNFSDDFHVIGAEWTPTTVTLYIDGLKIYTRAATWNYDDGKLGGPAHILLNFAVGGAWAGRHGIDDAAFPQEMQIDWVRVYQKQP